MQAVAQQAPYLANLQRAQQPQQQHQAAKHRQANERCGKVGKEETAQVVGRKVAVETVVGPVHPLNTLVWPAQRTVESLGQS